MIVNYKSYIPLQISCSLPFRCNMDDNDIKTGATSLNFSQVKKMTVLQFEQELKKLGCVCLKISISILVNF